VDEADIVKNDGEFIYLLSGSSIVILKAYPAEEAEILSYVDVGGFAQGLFVNGDRLVVIGDSGSRTDIRVYDVSDRSHPESWMNVSLDGSYLNSRMIGQYVYAIISNPACLDGEGEVDLPTIRKADEVHEIPASEIYYSDAPDYSYAFTTFVALNILSDEEPVQKTLLVGATREMCMSLNNAYIAIREFERTVVYRVRISEGEITCAATGEVPGYLLNQFSMDEHEGHFRIATTTGNLWGGDSRNNVYVLDMDLSIVGKLEELAPGERIYSARFIDDRCYLVTFKKVDPFFVVDLTEPSSPRVLGELKITGYSDYLHPYDENHMIGIGKETVAAEEGDFAWYQGVKMSLFDVSEVGNPREIAKYEVGDRGTDSPVLNDHKALLFAKSKNLLVIPILLAEIDEAQYPDGVPPYAYGEYVWQGAYVLQVTPRDGIVLEGRITHLDNGFSFENNNNYSYHIKRSLYIDSILYTISDKMIKMNDLDNLDEIGSLSLPEAP
jgi:uncharacterized secreted protein with C-terminal beta-propeller domain